MTQQLTVTGKPVFTEALPALTTSSPGHPDSWNPQYQALLSNDHFLRNAINAVGQGLAGFEDRLEGVEITSSAALDRAMRLNWLYGASRMALELFTPAWSQRDLDPVAVTSAVAGDDSIDLETTAGLQLGQEYVIAGAAGAEVVKVSQILTSKRIRITGVLLATYDNMATLSRTNWALSVGEAAAADGSLYFSKGMTLSSALGNHLVVIRRTASAAKTRLFFIDANNATWKEAPLLQQVATGVTDAGMADYTYQVPATGEFRLKVLVTGGAIKLRHLAAVTGRPATLAAAGIGDAYTKTETDAGLAAVPRTRVVTQPTVTGSTSVTPATNFTLTAAASSRLSGVTVASFDWTKPDGSKVNTVASNGSASLTLQVQGAVGETRQVSVEAIDSDGNRSAPRQVVLTITNNNAPSMATFAHTVPSGMQQAASQAVSFSGATDADGDAITYTFDFGSSGFTASKTSGIAPNESVTLTAPATTVPSDPRSFTVYAVDAKGARTGATINVNVIGQSLWEFTTPGAYSFTPPADGQYEVIVVGGGGAGGRYSTGNACGGGGGGSGYADRKVVTLKSAQQVSGAVGSGGTTFVGSSTIGTDGGTSSFGTELSAAGGKAALSTNGGAGGSGGASGIQSSTGTSTGGSDGSDGAEFGSSSRKGAGMGAGYYSRLDSTITHGRGGLTPGRAGGGGGGWGPTPAETTNYGGGYGAGGAGSSSESQTASFGGRSGYVRVKYLGA
ncbi:glycine-rich domain-containing protein [Pseudomonas benzopyrenica]|uniref:Glycine-rich domain-containing protein n=1 Tax=Pseudomonas benzopyrenica TaxID=2993566 RepID=A0ABZ2FVC4_9PSED